MISQAVAKPIFDKFFKDQGWKSQPFQIEVFESYFTESNIFISVPTGSGKTIAAFLPGLISLSNKKLEKQNPIEGELTNAFIKPTNSIKTTKRDRVEQSKNWSTLVSHSASHKKKHK